MKTNFFTQLAGMEFTGNLQLTIAKGTDGNLIVSAMLQNEQCGDKAKKLIRPLIFNAPPEEFDEGFIEQITAPIQKISHLLVDMHQYEKHLEEVKLQSAMAEKEKKAKQAKAKKFDEEMAKVDELDKQGEYRDAWTKVPSVDKYPNKKAVIQKRKAELSAKFAPNLFAPTEKEAPKPSEEEEPNPDVLYPPYQVQTVEEEMDFDNQY